MISCKSLSPLIINNQSNASSNNSEISRFTHQFSKDLVAVK
jgi:hypothetical protein